LIPSKFLLSRTPHLPRTPHPANPCSQPVHPSRFQILRRGHRGPSTARARSPIPLPAALVTALQPPPHAPIPARRFKAPSPPWSPPLHAPVPTPACRLQPRREMDRDGNDGYPDYPSQSGPAAGFDLFSQAASLDPAVHGPRRGMTALDLNSQTDFPNMDQYQQILQPVAGNGGGAMRILPVRPPRATRSARGGRGGGTRRSKTIAMCLAMHSMSTRSSYPAEHYPACFEFSSCLKLSSYLLFSLAHCYKKSASHLTELAIHV
jgi:hypothetical protein